MPARVLLVDDEDHIRTVLTDSLRSAGYEVESAPSGEDGFVALESRPADLMIVDLKMPGINGLEFSERAAEIAPDAQIVILTGYGDMRSAIDAMRAGVYDYLTKPVDLDRLLQTLHKAEERRRLILENRDLLRRLTEANRIKAEFINGMSHEVRTPLGHITGFAQILEDTLPDLNEKQTRYIRNIQNGATRLLDLFENILSFSTLKSGDVELVLESLDLKEILNTVIEGERALAVDRGVTLKTDDALPGRVCVDLKICSRALGLLVDNAIKFNREGGTVTLGGKIVGELPADADVADAGIAREWLAVSVADTGIGVAEDQWEHIFGLFTQADASLTRAHEGAGIGLALARSLARIHGGTVTVDSVVDVGSTFTLILPLYDAST